MINVKHPIEDKNIAQEQFLNTLPDNQKNGFALICSHTNAVYRYYNTYVDPNEQDYKEWLTALEELFKEGMQKLGYEACENILSFKRYVREKNDIGLELFVKKINGFRI